MERRIFGDYAIVKPIGQGTMGQVYLAEHRFMKKPYILKIFPEEWSSDRGFIQRFEEEIALLSSLEHPHLVKMYNVSFADGHYFLVMECIVDDMGESTNLNQYLINLGRDLEEEEVFSICRQVADVLDYVHGKKGSGEIYHRNLKLNNILIGKKGKEMHVFVSDVGLSRFIGPGIVLTRTLKNVAEALGIAQVLHSQKGDRPLPLGIEVQKLTPLHTSFFQNYSFLAPEQKRLDGTISGRKADVYAFGVLVYYLLCREWPEGIFPMPSERKRWQHDWDTLLKQCLSLNPHSRPESLLEALARIQCLSCADEVVSVETAPRPVIEQSRLDRPDPDFNPAAVFQASSAVKNYHPEARDVSNVKPLLTEMVVVPGGIYYRGSHDGNRDEMPRHQVMLDSFAIDVHPVTNEQFIRFLEVMGGEKDVHHNDIIRLRDSRIKRSGGKLSVESGYLKHPVVGVTWYGAMAYAKWVGKRLPTEAEWEIAASGAHDALLYPTGNDIEKSQANFFSSDTTAVMSYAPSKLGLYDMAGNVYEWCFDWYLYNYYELSQQEPENPQGPIQGVYRVLRGGCWKSLKEDLRCSRRHRNNPGTVNSTYGFRCVAPVK